MAAFTIAEEPARNDDVRWCLAQYCSEPEQRLEGGLDVAAALPLGHDDPTPPRGLVLVAQHGGAPAGCGAVKLAHPQVAEIKRLWVTSAARGRGLGGHPLAELEMRAIRAGKAAVRLDSNGSLTVAMGFYHNRGYREVEPFNDERYADHWCEKDLAPDQQP